MRKINKILQYNFTEYEIACLIEAEMINWCWWKGWIDFDKLIHENMEIIPWYKEKHFPELAEDFKMICHEHDFDFRTQVWFIRANYRMWKKLYKLLKDWAWRKEAFFIWLLAFALLTKYWKEFYKKASWKKIILK